MGLLHARGDGVELRAIERDQFAAKRVREKFFREISSKLLVATRHEAAKFVRRLEGRAVWQFTGGVHGQVTSVLRAPAADGIEVFQREPERINLAMALGAGGNFPVLF